MSESLIVDLSYGAAQKLGISGLGHVRIDSIAKNDAEMAMAVAADARVPEMVQVAANMPQPLVPSLPVVADR